MARKKSQKTEQDENEKKKIAEDLLSTYKQTQNRAKNWFWVGVLGISAIIFFFWGWSIISRVTSFSWDNSQESGLIKKSQEDWNKIFSSTGYALQDNLSIKNKLSDIVNEFKKQAEAETANKTIPDANSASGTTAIATTTITTNTIR